MTLQHELKRSLLLESYDQAHRFQRRENRHALLERIERSFRAFVQLASRSIGVDADHQRRAETARVIKIGDVTSMQNVEYAIGEDERAVQRRNSRGQVVSRGQLDGERGR